MRTRIILLTTLFSFGLVSSVWASNPGELKLGTATKGGGFQLFGKHLARVLNETQQSIIIKDIDTRGSKQNIPFLEQGKIDIGLVEGNAARQALEGIKRPKANLKVLSVMYPNPGMFVVRGDSTYKTIEDLKGQPIAFGTKASGLRILVNDVLDGLDLQPDKDFKQVILDKAAQGPKLVLSKQVEALWGAGIGWPGFVKVANGPAGANFIGPSQQQVTQILKRHPHLQRMSIPANTYKGQSKQIDSIGLWSLILIKPTVPDDTVYQLVKSLHQAETLLAKGLKQARYTTVKNTMKAVPREQLHPGVIRYYKEHNLL